METGKTLLEMSTRERFDLFETVADALEHKADEALDIGDTLSASNHINLATAIRGLNSNETAEGLYSAELLLQLGINYCVAGDDVVGRHLH